MTGFACGVGVDIAALEQVVETSNAIPAISIGFKDERMFAALSLFQARN